MSSGHKAICMLLKLGDDTFYKPNVICKHDAHCNVTACIMFMQAYRYG